MEITPLSYDTRPQGTLLPQEEAAFSLLEQLGIHYGRVSSDPADTMEKCAAVSQVLGVAICKNLFLCNRQKTQFYLLCMGPDKPFHTKDLSHQDRLRQAVLRPGGRPLGTAPLHPRLRHHPGTGQRHGAPCPVADGAGGL